MAFNANKLTEKAQEAVISAQRLAEERQYTLPRAPTTCSSPSSPRRVASCRRPGEDRHQSEDPAPQAETAVGALPRMTTPPAQVHVSNELIRLLDAAQREAERLKDDYTSTEHLLLALADDQSGAAAQILRSAGVTRDKAYQARSSRSEAASASPPRTPSRPTSRSSGNGHEFHRARPHRASFPDPVIGQRRGGPKSHPGPADQEQPGP